MEVLKVRDIMDKKPRIVPPHMPLERIFKCLGTDPCLLVVERGKLRGIITESDFLHAVSVPTYRVAVGAPRMKWRARTASELMTPHPITVSPDDSLGDALELMRRKKLRHLPVVDGEKVVGLLTLRAVLLRCT